MTSGVEVSRIVLKIGDKEIELSLDEARELRQVLDENFGREEKASHDTNGTITICNIGRQTTSTLWKT